jgi:hypothetical protein
LASNFLIWAAWIFFAPNRTGCNRLHEGEMYVPRDCYLLLDFFKNRGHTALPPQSETFRIVTQETFCNPSWSSYGHLALFECMWPAHTTWWGLANILQSSEWCDRISVECQLRQVMAIENLAFSHLLLGLVLPMAITWYDNTFCFACSGGYPVYKAPFYLELDELFC